MTLAVRPQTREQWLEAAVDALRPLFAEIDVELPRVRVSVGWPSRGGLGNKKKVIGQCWKTTVAADGVPQLFISPTLDVPADVLATLIHELIHAVDDCESGHGGSAKKGTGFRGMATQIGLEGKMTATHAGRELNMELVQIERQLGEYPHSALNPSAVVKKQSTRMLKLECPNDGYIVRTTAKWLDALGLPSCPCGEEMELA